MKPISSSNHLYLRYSAPYKPVLVLPYYSLLSSACKIDYQILGWMQQCNLFVKGCYGGKGRTQNSSS